jgi:Zn-dependent M28 family amino/carboxypeptidase
MSATAEQETLEKGTAERVCRRQSQKRRAVALLLIAALGSLLVRRSRNHTATSIAFDGPRAFDDLRNIVRFGPRPPGSAALAETRQYISAELSEEEVDVWHDNFIATTPAGEIPMTNIVGVIAGRSSSVVMIAGHYDTARLDGVQFLGANDGGSSTAMLLELARALKKRKNRLTYWLVFFDGEEALKRWSASDSLYGSRHMAEQLEADGRLKQIRALVNVDMVGDRHLDILRESNSTPWLSDIVSEGARHLGYGRCFEGGEFPVEDDHLPFLRKGVPSVDIIDLTPFKSYHHTAQDTLDKCSPESLNIVGRVIMRTIEQLELKFE